VPSFDDLIFHSRFEAHQAEAERPIVSEGEAEEVWYRKRRIVRNKKSGRGPYLMIGRTEAGRGITVVLLTTDDPGVWCAYTAWDTE
jgi:hypothetical protein